MIWQYLFIKQSSGDPETLHFAMGKTSANVKAQLMAIHMTLLHIRNKSLRHIVILADSMTVLQRIQGEVKDA